MPVILFYFDMASPTGELELLVPFFYSIEFSLPLRVMFLVLLPFNQLVVGSLLSATLDNFVAFVELVLLF